MALTVYNTEQAEEWDTVVRSFREYDTYWLSGYVKAFRIHGDGDPLLFYYEGNGTRGINAVMKRDIAKDPRFFGKLEEGTYFDFSTPYGYGGWIVEGDIVLQHLITTDDPQKLYYAKFSNSEDLEIPYQNDNGKPEYDSQSH